MKNSFYGLSLAVIVVVSFFLIVDSMDDASAYKSKKNSSFSKSENTKTQLNKYSNYVHLQPEWNSYPSNLIFDVSIFWNRDNTVIQESDSYGGAKNRINSLQYLEDKPYIEVQYDYIDCNYQWIHYARYGLDILNSKLDYWSGKQLGSGHDSALFSKIPVTNTTLGSNSTVFLQFIPICTSKNITSFDYGVRIDDKDVGFDVYFVPSVQERLDYFTKDGFEHHEGCYGLGYSSFSGTCIDVGKNSGLLIAIPDALEKPLTKIYVKLKEIQT